MAQYRRIIDIFYPNYEYRKTYYSHSAGHAIGELITKQINRTDHTPINILNNVKTYVGSAWYNTQQIGRQLSNEQFEQFITKVLNIEDTQLSQLQGENKRLKQALEMVLSQLRIEFDLTAQIIGYTRTK